MRTVRKISSPREVKESLAPLFKEAGLQLVLLFGSMASGKANEKSDIDLGFLLDESKNILDLTNSAIRLLKNDSIDVVDLRLADPLLKFIAATKGKLLYERTPGLFNSFYSLAVRRYLDTKKLRKAQEMFVNSYIRERNLL